MLPAEVLHYDLSMERDKLQKDLGQLKVEITKLQESDVEAASRLNSLLADIESSIDSDFPQNPDIRTAVQDNLKYFEATHPVITDVLNRIATLLSNMGI